MTKDRLEQLRNGVRKLNEDVEIEECGEDAVLNPKKKNSINKSMNKDCVQLDEILKIASDQLAAIENINANILEVKRGHVILQQSTRVDPATREKNDELNERIMHTAMMIKEKIKELESKKTGEPSSVINRVIVTQSSLIHKKLQETMAGYENALSAHKQIYETIIKKQLQIVINMVKEKELFLADKEVTDDELLAILDAQDTAYMKETAEAMTLLQDARDRHQAILAIEKDINTLKELFCDFAIHVSRQGELIDKIEYHVGNGVVLAHKGQKRLNKAHKNQKRSRKKKFYLLICLISTLIILVLLLAITYIQK